MARTPVEVWNEFQDLASKYVKGVLSLGPEALAQKYKEYLETLPPTRRNGIIVILDPKTGKSRSIKRTDIPRLLIEDPEFRKMYLRVVSEAR